MDCYFGSESHRDFDFERIYGDLLLKQPGKSDFLEEDEAFRLQEEGFGCPKGLPWYHFLIDPFAAIMNLSIWSYVLFLHLPTTVALRNPAGRGLQASTVTQCPDTPGQATILPTGTTEIRLERSVELCTLTVVTETAAARPTLQPVARTYSSKDWERSAGNFVDRVRISCDTAACTISLPRLASNTLSRYHVTTLLYPDHYNERTEAARFLEQTTFGPTLAEITGLLEGGGDLRANMAAWIHQQQTEVPVFSHRAYFRRHLSHSRQARPNPSGSVTHPCQAGTQYRKLVFTNYFPENDDLVEFDFVEDERVLILRVKGFIMTVLGTGLRDWDDVVLDDMFPSGNYAVCWVDAESVYFEHPTVRFVLTMMALLATRADHLLVFLFIGGLH